MPLMRRRYLDVSTYSDTAQQLGIHMATIEGHSRRCQDPCLAIGQSVDTGVGR